ncbi:hypothetical protein [Aureibacter tunicatorum]|uniref:DUF3592 domain-containing protein n=1 Tax=Aureibacter tunicatorum TaxID=866807 RepID=A0AAE3XPX3_9BACT|nr:hypothetical protein [Aureibacter tunicatorum]MDR6239879.1 hypothetical protein [Aureibacter tunicatorum]BDD04354.1 hypothetical protein AUTU_18370 [Aureibacter tunicatorum]
MNIKSTFLIPNALRWTVLFKGFLNGKLIGVLVPFLICFSRDYDKVFSYSYRERKPLDNLTSLSDEYRIVNGSVTSNHDHYYLEFEYKVPGIDKTFHGYSYDHSYANLTKPGEPVVVIYDYNTPSVSRIDGLHANEGYDLIYISMFLLTAMLLIIFRHIIDRMPIFRALKNFQLKLAIRTVKSMNRDKHIYKFIDNNDYIRMHRALDKTIQKKAFDDTEIIIVNPKTFEGSVLLKELPSPISSYVKKHHKELIDELLADETTPEIIYANH